MSPVSLFFVTTSTFGHWVICVPSLDVTTSTFATFPYYCPISWNKRLRKKTFATRLYCLWAPWKHLFSCDHKLLLASSELLLAGSELLLAFFVKERQVQGEFKIDSTCLVSRPEVGQTRLVCLGCLQFPCEWFSVQRDCFNIKLIHGLVELCII